MPLNEVSVEIDDTMLEIMAAEEVLLEKGAPVVVMVQASQDEHEMIAWALAANGSWRIDYIVMDEKVEQCRMALLKAAPAARARAVPFLTALVWAVAKETAKIDGTAVRE